MVETSTQRAASALFDLSGRNAVVTGAASGLGRAIAVGLAEQGASVAIADINEPEAKITGDLIRAAAGTAIEVTCDITEEDQVDTLFSRVSAELGPVDILINDAFVPVLARPHELTRELWDKAINVNLSGSFLCARAAGRQMIERDAGGAIVNMSSISATTALGRGAFVYSVTKAGLAQMTRELAIEWARYGIRVNAIQPCQMRTAGLQARFDDPMGDGDALMARLVDGIPLGRIGEPEDVVGPIVFLVSDAARLVTGVVLPVDGGNLALNAGGERP